MSISTQPHAMLQYSRERGQHPLPVTLGLLGQHRPCADNWEPRRRAAGGPTFPQCPLTAPALAEIPQGLGGSVVAAWGRGGSSWGALGLLPWRTLSGEFLSSLATSLRCPYLRFFCSLQK